MVKSLFLRYFSVSSKVFFPVAYIMNGIQHLTTPTCLKFCLGIMLFIWPPTPQNLAPAVPSLAPTFIIWRKRWRQLFYSQSKPCSSRHKTISTLYADGRTDELIPVYARKHSFCGGMMKVDYGNQLRGSVVKCLTRNHRVLGFSCTGSSGFFCWECPWATHFRAPA